MPRSRGDESAGRSVAVLMMAGFFRIVVMAVAAMMMISLAACGGGRGRDAEAQELADAVLPGQLRVLSTAVEWYPAPGGLIPTPHTSAVFAVVDDPDAVVKINSLQAETLRDAVVKARAVAAQFRALEAAMGSVGVGVVGFGAGQIYLAIDLAPGTVSADRARLDRGLTAWRTDFDELQDEPLSGQFALHLVRSDVTLPDGRDPSEPRLSRWSSTARQKALTAATEHQAFVHIDRDGVEPVANSLQPALSSSEQDQARQAVQAAAESVVGTPTGPVQWSRSFYLTDDLDRVRMYCFLVQGRGVIAVTVSLPDLDTSQVTTLELEDGPIPRTLEPDLVPG